MKKFELDIPAIKAQDFESMFKQWFQLVSGHDPQHYQDLEWEWEEEIEKFIEDPGKEYNYQLSVKQEDDEFLEKESEEYFTNSFGIRMKRLKK